MSSPVESLSGQLLRKLRAGLQLPAEVLIAFTNRELQPLNGTLRDLSCRDQFCNRATQRLFIGLQQGQATVQQSTVSDRDQQQNRHQTSITNANV